MPAHQPNLLLITQGHKEVLDLIEFARLPRDSEKYRALDENISDLGHLALKCSGDWRKDEALRAGPDLHVDLMKSSASLRDNPSLCRSPLHSNGAEEADAFLAPRLREQDGAGLRATLETSHHTTTEYIKHCPKIWSMFLRSFSGLESSPENFLEHNSGLDLCRWPKEGSDNLWEGFNSEATVAQQGSHFGVIHSD